MFELRWLESPPDYGNTPIGENWKPKRTLQYRTGEASCYDVLPPEILWSEWRDVPTGKIE